MGTRSPAASSSSMRVMMFVEPIGVSSRRAPHSSTTSTSRCETLTAETVTSPGPSSAAASAASVASPSTYSPRSS